MAVLKALGKKKWIIPGGHIPLKSTGREPDMVSQDKIAILNTGLNAVKVRLTVFYSDDDPVNNYILEVKGQRLKKIRINDLIDPFPVTLETDYSLVIEAGEPVVVQFLRMDTGYRNIAIMGTIGFGTDL
jgi:hypothetical protein